MSCEGRSVTSRPSRPAAGHWFHERAAVIGRRRRNDHGVPGVWLGEPEVNGHCAMKGLITGRDVVLHTFTIIRLWGLPTYVRCLRATLSRTPTTFLAVVHACGG